MNSSTFPTRQGELIKRARGTRAQADFAEALKISRSCLSRYENEKLGAPTKVINHCLSAIAAQLAGIDPADPIETALNLSRSTTRQLELAKSKRSG
ncbi:transcriptional regulator [Roseateles violae]|uniref:Transcriptional regulator n=1 Tax=Roseateles violae TaxID=3058042 RepID=A0ABT8DST4_9BURK|nr:transcriptional regulator [Pelomonas sp. PFR6]MDN3919364.1 transcriptional regulator [Pelomonas sp. PFR6]